MVKEEGFVRLMNHLKSKYPIPNRCTMSNKIIPNMYEVCRDLIMTMLTNISHISFTTDFWSSNSGDQFLSLTGHCTFENFDVQVVVLYAKPFFDRHTGVNIAATIDSMIEEYHIPDNKVHFIVHDSASNMIKGIDQSKFDS